MNIMIPEKLNDNGHRHNTFQFNTLQYLYSFGGTMINSIKTLPPQPLTQPPSPHNPPTHTHTPTHTQTDTHPHTHTPYVTLMAFLWSIFCEPIRKKVIMIVGIELCPWWIQITIKYIPINYVCFDTVFFKTRGHLLVRAPPRLASPGLALPCLVMPCLVLPGFECDAFSSNIKNEIHMVGLF